MPVGACILTSDVMQKHFTEKDAAQKAEETATLGPLPLHEATFIPETIQFYVTKPVAFDSDAGFELNRELGKLGIGHTTDRKKLLLK